MTASADCDRTRMSFSEVSELAAWLDQEQVSDWSVPVLAMVRVCRVVVPYATVT